MPSPEPADTRSDRLHRLAAAMEAFVQYRAGATGTAKDRFLDEHAALRDLLEPMFDGIDAQADETADAETVDGADAEPRPGRCLGDYRLLREVGRGGMGVVYEAQQISLRRRVALKVLPHHRTTSPRAIERFRHEAALASRLRHPSIVPIHEVGEWRGIHYYSMEFVDGRPLHVVMQEPRLGVREDCSRVAEAAELVARLASALQHAHEQGLVHRDVKPHNVMIGTDGSVRLMDFGVAKDLGAATWSVAGEFLGTPHYCSPEQITGAPIGPTSDVFSLGILLYELLAHRRPFEGDDPRAVLRRIEVGEFPSLRHVAPTVPRDLVTICHKALERHPDHRYPTAGACADDLRRFLRIEPIHATPPSLLTRSTKWVRRHRLRLAVAVLTALSVIGAPAAYAWHLHRTNATIEAERVVLDQAEDLAFRSIEQTLSLLADQLDRRPDPGSRSEPQVDAVIALCESFLGLRRDLPQRRVRVAAALELVAGIYTNLDRLAPADLACTRAEALLAGAPGDDEERHPLLQARLLHRRMVIAQLHEVALGDGPFAAADAAWQRLIDAAPDDPAPRLGRLQTLLQRSRSLADDPRRRAEAERLLERFRTELAAAPLASSDEAPGLAAQGDVTLGQLLVHTGRSEAALRLLETTLPRLDALPADPLVGVAKAHAMAMIGAALQRLERPREAEAMLREAIRTADHWSGVFPGSRRLRRTLVSARVVLGSQLLADGDAAAAESQLRDAATVDMDAEAIDGPATAPGYVDRMLAAELYRLLSDCLLLQHVDGSRDEEARALLERAVQLGRDLLAVDPDAVEPLVGTATACNSLAMFANERGDHAAAAEHAEEAIRLQRRALVLIPQNRRAAALLGIQQANLAHALARLSRWQEAVPAARQAVQHAPEQVAALRMAAEAAARAAAATGDEDAAALAVTALGRIADLDEREARRLLADRRFTSLAGRADFRALAHRLDPGR